jgi:outer membrane protein
MRAALIVALLTACFANSAFAQNPNAPMGSPTAGQTAQSGTPLTLQQAEAMTLRNNPQITIGKLRALQAQQYVRETRSALLPTAYLSLTGVDAESGSRIAAGGINNPILFTRAAGGATVSQLVTDFGIPSQS